MHGLGAQLEYERLQEAVHALDEGQAEPDCQGPELHTGLGLAIRFPIGPSQSLRRQSVSLILVADIPELGSNYRQCHLKVLLLSLIGTI